MKKTYVLMLLLIATLVPLSACGGKNTNLDANAQPVEKGIQETETAQEYEPTQEILDAPLDSYKFQLGDTVLQFPCTVGDLLNAGASYKNSEFTENAFLPGRKNDNIRNTQSQFIQIVLGSQTFSVAAANYTENDVLLTDCTIIYLTCDYKDGASPPPSVFFPGGLALGSIDHDLVEQYKAFDLKTIPQTEAYRIYVAENKKNGETNYINYNYYPNAE